MPLLVVCIIVFWALPAQAQLWSGIIDSSRATDWSQAGATITNRTHQCVTAACTIVSGGNVTAITINNAINSTTAGDYVQIPSGAFTLSGGIDFNGKNNVALRGNGPNNTTLAFTGTVQCGGPPFQAAICMGSSNKWSISSGATVATLTGPFPAGTTSLTFSATTNLIVGSLVVIDQLDDSNTDTGEVWVCSTQNTCSSEGPAGNARGGNRSTQQVVTITNIAGSVVTFTPGLHASYWVSSKTPQAVWGGGATGQATGQSVEELAVDASGMTGDSIIVLNCVGCWVKAFQSYKPDRAHIQMFQAARMTIRDSYFDEGKTHTSESYGIEHTITSDCLIENSIFHHISTPFSINGSGSGCVYGYNYSLNNTFFAGSDSGAAWMHAAGTDTILFEGNHMPAWFSDMIHGSHHFITLFRNYSTGWESGLTAQTNPIIVNAFGRFYNIVGNVLGTSGYHTIYANPSSDAAIYHINLNTITSGQDTLVTSTMFRWGNYDTVNAATRFLPGEVPFALAKYANAVPSGQTLPNSFYLSAKPSWWGSVAWPPIGPDVTGGNQDGGTTAGHVNKIPARLCYESSAKDANGKLTAFSPDTCYVAGGSDTTPPAAPQNLRITRWP